MEAAERMFLAKGIAETSIDEIVLAADVAKGTFYLHFGSKEELLFAIQDRWVVSFSARVLAAVNRRREDDHRGRLRAFIESSVEGYVEGGALHDLVFHEFRPEKPPAKHENPLVEMLATLLEEGTRASSWSVASPHRMAVMLFHALHGAMDDALHSRGAYASRSAPRGPVSAKKLATELEIFFRRAVGLG